MKKLVVFFAFLSLGVCLFVKVILDTGVNTIIDSLADFSLLNFVIICTLTAMNFFLYSFRWDIILRHFEPTMKVPLRKLYMARTSGYAVSYLTPVAQVGGEPVRIFFLTQAGVKTKHAVASVVVDKVLESTSFIALSVVGVALAFHLGLFDSTVNIILWRTLIGAIIFLFVLYYAIFFKSGFISKLIRILHLTKFKRIYKIERKIAEIEDMMSDFCTGHYIRFAFLMLLSVINVLVYIFEHFVLAFFLGVTLTAMQSFFVTAIPNVSFLIPIPAALGALESFSVGIFDILGISINAVALVLIVRIRDFIIVAVGIIYASGHGLHMIRDAFKSLRK